MVLVLLIVEGFQNVQHAQMSRPNGCCQEPLAPKYSHASPCRREGLKTPLLVSQVSPAQMSARPRHVEG